MEEKDAPKIIHVICLTLMRAELAHYLLLSYIVIHYLKVQLLSTYYSDGVCEAWLEI